MSAIFTSKKDSVLQDFNQKLRYINTVVGGMAESYAKKYAPVDTGNLRNSISHDQEDNYMTVVIGTNVYYAPYQELGAPNANVPPHPFLRPAVENHKENYRRAIEHILKT